MPFCDKCGADCKEDARFCTVCGNKLFTGAASAPLTGTGSVSPADTEIYRKFSGIAVRYRCSCGHVFDGNESTDQCPKCGAPLAKGGYVQLYRKGNFMGAAVGMGIYVDDVPFGHIANRQSIRLNIPFGIHKLHITHTTTRLCNDPIITLTPENPYIFCKAHFTGAGFKINVDITTPDDMPVS